MSTTSTTLVLHSTAKLKPLTLALPIVVDWVRHQGAGISIHQTASHAATGTSANYLLPLQITASALKQQDLRRDHITSAADATLVALIHALNATHRSVEDVRRNREDVVVQDVVFLCAHKAVVDEVNHHLADPQKSLPGITSSNKRNTMKRFIRRARRVVRLGVNISFVDVPFSSEDMQQAKKYAKHKGRKACRSRRKQQLRAAALDNVHG